MLEPLRILIFTLVVGCTVDGLDLEGRECPCIDGWTCDEARNLCVRDEPEDAGLGDVGVGDGGQDAFDPDANVDAPGFDGGDDDAGGDASGVDGGPSDAGMEPDTTPPRDTECDSLDVLLCEGFEDDLSQWNDDRPDGTETEIVLGPNAYRGRGMLYSYIDGREGYSVLHARVWEDDTDDLWVRMHYYIDSDLATDTEVLELFNTGYDYSVPFYVQAGYANLHSHGIFDDDGWDSSVVPPQDEWVCAEMHMHRDPTAGYIELFVNGALGVRTPDLDITSPFNELAIGMVYGSEEGAVYVDEVVAHTSRVPCP